ncbi:TetR/AcrR family transcriptional regulator [Streptomyces neyagawaensis]|uniref:TetR/AcrR family transcriptional regulator n=1 Tax=Streptomyces neyagawaensis TaxID=42238 RepID=UPI0006E2924E|nr:TetR/AcrR family transcriptional regulator [Streptomyces neyagawaensis]MCL6739133.1 TetR/AcrR family transcriptional regulator [Streptomyces neyagawaensis]MDE1686987.1 TetR/AcrR family transcriptional regulator [Streptomyces neyagawaensis]
MTLADQPTRTTEAPPGAGTAAAPAQPAKRGRRADAERNRAAILEAAGAVFAEQGCAVDVREIARRSGVGMGTLYRHFPTKDDLLATVLEQEYTAWLTDAHQRASATKDPWQALAGFFEQMLTTQSHNRAVIESYASTGGPSECAQRCYALIDYLRTRCLDAGLLRPDVTTADLVLLSGSLSQAVLTTGDTHPGQWRRLLHISLDGLSSRNTEPLPELAPAADAP